MLLKVFYIFHEVMSKLSYYVLLIILLRASINMDLISFLLTNQLYIIQAIIKFCVYIDFLLVYW